MADDSAQSGYYRDIARAYLARRGGPLLLTARVQAAIAAWEADRVPLRVVLEGVGRAFDDLKARGRASRAVPLAFCDRAVRAAFAQHRDRAAGRHKPAAAGPARPDKRERARREIGQALASLPAGETGMKSLLAEALGVLDREPSDSDALERIDAAIEEALWAGATEAEKADAATEARKSLKGRSAARGHVPGTCPPAGFADTAKRLAVQAARARRRVPHVSLHYY